MISFRIQSVVWKIIVGLVCVPALVHVFRFTIYKNKTIMRYKNILPKLSSHRAMVLNTNNWSPELDTYLYLFFKCFYTTLVFKNASFVVENSMIPILFCVFSIFSAILSYMVIFMHFSTFML